jgi:hypothetical protein
MLSFNKEVLSMQDQVATNRGSVTMPLRGWRAARWYLEFFRDPIGSLGKAYRAFGPVSAVGRIAGPGRGRLHWVALGPEGNHAVLGNPDLFRATGQT